jgi:AcrR family transcriptional regulator
MGITPSSLYNHFPGKQALYAAVLQRGVEPIMELVADAWQRGVSRREDVRATMAAMVPHLAAHPHLARLLQRAMLEESPEVRALIARWLEPLYRKGLGVVGKVAGDAGWERDDAPHLAIMLFEMLFGYFANATALQQLAGWTDDPLSEPAVAHQQRILEEAIFRLLGPRRQRAPRKRRKCTWPSQDTVDGSPTRASPAFASASAKGSPAVAHGGPRSAATRSTTWPSASAT